MIRILCNGLQALLAACFLLSSGSAPAADPSSATLDAIKQRKAIVIGYLKDAYPMSFIGQDGNWTTILHPKVRIYHEDPPDSTGQQVRIATHVTQAPFAEVLTWSMPAMSATGGTLAMHWGTTVVRVAVGVEPTLRMTMPANEAAPYLGSYTYTARTGPDHGKTKTLAVTYEDSTLKGQWTPDDDYFRKFALIRIAPDWFAPGVYDDKGQIYEVYKPEMTFEFKVVSRKAVSLEMRNEADEVEAAGQRKP
jgi:hypothetical protein